MTRRLPFVMAGLMICLFGLSGIVFVLLSPEAYDNGSDITGYQGIVYDPGIALSDFTMPASTGVDLKLSDLQGQWVLIFFGFTHCPDLCPMTLSEYRQIYEDLGDAAEALQPVFISVDGERDSPALLARYLERFHPDFIGLSGDEASLSPLESEFGLYYERREHSAGAYSMDHTTRSYLIDPEGRLRVSYSYGTDHEIITENILDLMSSR